MQPQMPNYETPLVAEEIARTDGELLKETSSYCPTCMKVLAARVYAHNGIVWLYKECPQHGPSQGLVEKNVGFYKKVMNHGSAPEMPYWSLLLPITHSCNLNCKLCFVPNRERQDLSVDHFKRIIDETEIPWIVMSGGEPTLHPKLPELIRHTCKAGKFPAMNSNGIKLADRDYTKMLADAGLNSVALAFNGTDDSVYEEINGRPLLDIKLQALQNLTENGIAVLMSPTIMRGINEDLGPLIKLCFDHWPEAYQIRMRGAARVGVHTTFEPLVTSELVQLVAQPIGKTLDQLIEEFDQSKSHHAVTQWIMEVAFYAEGPRYGEVFGWHSGDYALEQTTSGQLGGTWLSGQVESSSTPEILSKRTAVLGFHIWGWPDRYNIDLEEIKSTGVAHLYGEDTVLSFYDAIVRAHDL